MVEKEERRNTVEDDRTGGDLLPSSGMVECGEAVVVEVLGLEAIGSRG